MKKTIYITLVVIAIGIVSFIISKNLFLKDNEENKAEVIEDIQISSPIEDEPLNQNEDQDDINQDEEDIEKYIRYDSQGSVDVGIMFKNLAEKNEDNLQFEVMLNTHSVNLDDIDYGNLVSLVTDNGEVISDGFQWLKTEGSGHHIFGYLEIPKKYKGVDIIDSSTKYVELEIKGLDNIESRKFKWEEDMLKSFE